MDEFYATIAVLTIFYSNVYCDSRTTPWDQILDLKNVLLVIIFWTVGIFKTGFKTEENSFF